MKSFIAGIISVIVSFVPPSSRYGIQPEQLPDHITDTSLSAVIAELPSMDAIYGLRGKKLKNNDFSEVSVTCLASLAFDDGTQWPGAEYLPEGFFPETWLEKGKDPGLSTRLLHKRGITGTGISVAVIDKPLDPDHCEFTGRIEYAHVDVPAESYQKGRHFHGLACASVLCGIQCGVAPGATLYYFAVYDNGKNQENYCTAMKALLEFNKTLPQTERIRVISISDNVSGDPELVEQWHVLHEQAQQDGIVVVYSSGDLHERFTWGGSLPVNDPNDPESYLYNEWSSQNDSSVAEKILVPADFRTLAGDDNSKQYAYQGTGGFSYAIPYIAGLVTLARSVGCEKSFAELIDIMANTAFETDSAKRVINPVDFIEAVQSLTP